VGFAVPVNTVKRVAPQLIQNGRAVYPYLGITTSGAERFTMPELAAALNLSVARGVLIQEVAPGGPADIAGLRGGDSQETVRGIPILVGGDIIIAIDDVPVRDFDHLSAYLITTTEVGQVVKITILRGGETLDLALTIGERPR
jgi:2-alkenal reductase